MTTHGARTDEDGFEHVGGHWTVELLIDEYDGQTRARAKLHWLGRISTGVGFSPYRTRNPKAGEIGDELAAARALTDLANRLTAAGAHDMDSIAGTP